MANSIKAMVQLLIMLVQVLAAVIAETCVASESPLH